MIVISYEVSVVNDLRNFGACIHAPPPRRVKFKNQEEQFNLILLENISLCSNENIKMNGIAVQ